MIPKLPKLANPHMSVMFFWVDSVSQDPGNDVPILNANDDSGICARKRAGDAFRKVVTICGLIRLIMFRFGSGS